MKQKDLTNTVDVTQTNRNSAISYIRFIAMVMIIICHYCQYYGNELAWWLNVGAQIFFVISGFLYGGKDIDRPMPFIKKQFVKLLVPYYVFLIPVIALYAIFARESLSVSSVVRSLFCVGTIEGIKHLWFVGYMLLCYLMTPLLSLIRKKTEGYSFVKTTVVFVAILCAVVAVFELFSLYFDASRISCYLVGYFISVYCQRYGKKAQTILTALFASVAIAVNGARIYIKYFYGIDASSAIGRIFTFAEKYAHLLLGVTLFLVLYALFRKARVGAIVRASDKYSYPIYIVHQLFILSPFSLMQITPIKYVNWIIVILAIVACAYLVHFISKTIQRNKLISV